MVSPLGSLDRFGKEDGASTTAEAREARGVPVRHQATIETAEWPDGWTEDGTIVDVQTRSGSRCKGLAMAATTKWVLHGEPWLEDSVDVHVFGCVRRDRSFDGQDGESEPRSRPDRGLVP